MDKVGDLLHQEDASNTHQFNTAWKLHGNWNSTDVARLVFSAKISIWSTIWARSHRVSDPPSCVCVSNPDFLGWIWNLISEIWQFSHNPSKTFATRSAFEDVYSSYCSSKGTKIDFTWGFATAELTTDFQRSRLITGKAVRWDRSSSLVQVFSKGDVCQDSPIRTAQFV